MFKKLISKLFKNKHQYYRELNTILKKYTDDEIDVMWDSLYKFFKEQIQYEEDTRSDCYPRAMYVEEHDRVIKNLNKDRELERRCYEERIESMKEDIRILRNQLYYSHND